MKISRRAQALIPLIITPLVLLGINGLGSDKAPILIIPWIAFSIVYLPWFLALSKRFASSALLTLVSAFAALMTAYLITFLLLSYLSSRASGLAASASLNALTTMPNCLPSSEVGATISMTGRFGSHRIS